MGTTNTEVTRPAVPMVDGSRTVATATPGAALLEAKSHLDRVGQVHSARMTWSLALLVAAVTLTGYALKVLFFVPCIAIEIWLASR